MWALSLPSDTCGNISEWRQQPARRNCITLQLSLDIWLNKYIIIKWYVFPWTSDMRCSIVSILEGELCSVYLHYNCSLSFISFYWSFHWMQMNEAISPLNVVLHFDWHEIVWVTLLMLYLFEGIYIEFEMTKWCSKRFIIVRNNAFLYSFRVHKVLVCRRAEVCLVRVTLIEL